MNRWLNKNKNQKHSTTILPVTVHQDSISTSHHTNYPFEINVHQSSQSALSSTTDLRKRRINSNKIKNNSFVSFNENEEQPQTILPFADDESEIQITENDDLIVPVVSGLQSRQSSYTSHLSRLSYSSHSELPFKLGLETVDQKSPSKDDFDVQNIHNQTFLFQNEVSLNCSNIKSKKTSWNSIIDHN